MTRQSKRMARSTTMLVLVLLIGGCKSACEVTEKPSPTPNAVQLTGTGDTYAEITAAASPPLGGTGPCADGMIIVSAGDGTQQLLMGRTQPPLPASYDLAGWVGTAWAKRGTGSIPPPGTTITAMPAGSDSQTARLANGDLLLMWNGSTTSVLPNSADLPWWDDWGPSPGPEPKDLPQFAGGVWPPAFPRAGYRAAQVFWRYSCAQGKWLDTTMLDGGLAKALPSPPAIPPIKNEDGISKPLAEQGHCVKSPPWVRGFDRPELYVDPWGVDPADNSKQRIFVSTRCSRFDDDSTQVFASWDSGATWNPSGIRLAASTPVVMTTTKDRLFLFQDVDGLPVLHWSDDHGASLATPPGGYDISFVPPPTSPDPNAPLNKTFPVSWLSSNETGVGESQAPTLSLAHAGPNAVLAVYPALETFNLGPGQFSRQVAAVVCVIPKGPGEAPTVIPIKIIRAQGALGSVLMPTFIEDDRPDAKFRTNLLYWVETVSPPAVFSNPTQMIARYVTFTGLAPSSEKLLSDAAGWQTKIRNKYAATGDYTKGAYYFHNGVMNFVPVWLQVPASVVDLNQNQVFMRIISLQETADPTAAPDVDKMAGAKPASLAKPAKNPPRPIPNLKP